MILENRPDEIPRLKRYANLFEAVTWAVITSAYALSWLMPDEAVNHFLINSITLVAAASTIVFYRILPFEKRAGSFIFTFRLKAFIIGILNIIMISVLVSGTGGIKSPFWYLYLLSPLSAALYFPAWAIATLTTWAVILYLITIFYISPHLGVPYFTTDFPVSIFTTVTAVFFVVVLAYSQAKELTIEGERSLRLVNEVTGERNKLSTVLESVADGVFALDYKRRVVFINKSMENLLGTAEKDLIDKEADLVFKFYNGNRRVTAIEFCPLKKVANDTIVYEGSSLKFLDRSKKEIFLNLASTAPSKGPLIDVGCIVVIHNVSKERELEAMKLDFVSIAAHELRTPITSARGYLSILEQELKNKLNGEERNFLERAQISTDQLSSLVENLLDVSRIEKGAIKLDITKIQIEELIERIVDNYKEAASQKGIALAYIRNNIKMPPVAIDKFRISEVLSNLISNAVTYTSKGRVEVRTSVKERFVVTSVKDTGEGIPAEAIPNLFTKFFRVSGPLEQGSKGTGLGLYISKAIVDLHSGKIWVESELGRGSTFYFSVPIYQSKNYL